MTSAMTTQTAYDTSYGGNAADNYERYFVPAIGAPFGIDLVAEAKLRPGERVLDVACGTGIIARLAAERVGTAGAVAALDINAAMLGVARTIPTAIPVKWYESGAESMPLPDASFDVVFCQLALQFITDKHAALRELHRVLAPGGRLYINTPRPNAFFAVLERAIARHIGEEAAGFVRAVFSLHDPAELHDLLTQAGFASPAVRVHRKRLALPAARDFMWQYIYCTPLMAMVQPAGSDQGNALESTVVAGWEPWAAEESMSCDQEVLVGTARR